MQKEGLARPKRQVLYEQDPFDRIRKKRWRINDRLDEEGQIS
jgi:hypothetical protein